MVFIWNWPEAGQSYIIIQYVFGLELKSGFAAMSRSFSLCKHSTKPRNPQNLLKWNSSPAADPEIVISWKREISKVRRWCAWMSVETFNRNPEQLQCLCTDVAEPFSDLQTSVVTPLSSGGHPLQQLCWIYDRSLSGPADYHQCKSVLHHDTRRGVGGDKDLTSVACLSETAVKKNHWYRRLRMELSLIWKIAL